MRIPHTNLYDQRFARNRSVMSKAIIISRWRQVSDRAVRAISEGEQRSQEEHPRRGRNQRWGWENRVPHHSHRVAVRKSAKTSVMKKRGENSCDR